MGLGKKGIVFTFMAIIISSLLATMFSTHQITPIDATVELEKARITAANQHLINILSYIQDATSISTYYALNGMIEYIWQEKAYYDDLIDINNSFISCILDEEIGIDACPNMDGKNITGLIGLIEQSSLNDLNIDTDIIINDIWIDQTHPFSVRTYVNVTIYINTTNTEWNQTKILQATTTIGGLKDPYFFREQFLERDFYNNTFEETRFTSFNITSFELFVNETDYKTTRTTQFFGEFLPLSFFGRLANSTEIKNDTGLPIISIVSPAILGDGDPDDNRSYVDFLYMNNITFPCDSIRKVVNTSNRPVVDVRHLSLEFGFNPASTELETLC